MPIPLDTRIELVESTADCNRLLDWLERPRPVLACDTETTGLNPHTGDKLRLVQFGDATAGWVIPWFQWGGLAVEVLERWHGRRMAFHNSPFDISFIENECDYRFDWSMVDDTRAMIHVLDSTRSTALKMVGSRLIDPRASAGEMLLKNAMGVGKWTFATVPVKLPEYWAYAGVDPVLTYYLREDLLPKLLEANAMNAYQLEVACARVIASMQRTGMRVDLPYCDQMNTKLLAYGEELQAWAADRYSCRNLGSNAACIRALELEGIVLEKRTKSGKQYALDEDVLLGIDHPLSRAIHRFRKSQKLASSYFQNLLEYAVQGVVHPSINQMGARTGRMSIQRPALQTLPKTSRTVRDAFIPREGHLLYSLDCQAIEMRLLAHFAGEPSMIRAIREGKDLHTFTAQLAYGVDVPTKGQRQIAKHTGFARIYGAGTAKLSLTAGVPLDVAREFQHRYDDLFPGVRGFISRVTQVGMSRKAELGYAYVQTPLGRVQRADPGKEYALVNYLIQGTAAEVMKRQLVDLAADPDLERGLLLTVHDEILLEVSAEDPERRAELANRARVIMEDRTNFHIPIEVECSEPLTRWGDVLGVPADLVQEVNSAFYTDDEQPDSPI